MEACPFCSFGEDDVVVYRDELLFAIVDKQPINRYHVLVIPKAHYTAITELPDDLATRLMLVVKRLSLALRRVASPDAVTHLFDDDVSGSGFNLIQHFKFHIIARYRGDAVKIEWNREPPPGHTARTKIAEQIIAAMD